MIKKRPVFSLLFLAFILAAFSAVPPGALAGDESLIIKEGERLGLGRCLAVALEREPSIGAALYNAEAARSRVSEAQSNYYPQVEASGGYSKSAKAAPGRSSASFSQGADLYTSGISLKQNIYDFGRTPAQVGVQEFNLGASRFDLENARNQIIFNVKQAYYGLLQAEKALIVSDESVKQAEAHLEQAKGFYEAGTKPRIDVTRAEVALSEARVSRIKAKNALALGRVTLNNAMGVPDAPDFEVEDDLGFQIYGITLEDALSRAFNARPDLKSAAEKRKALGEAVELAKKNYYPALSGNAGYNWSGERFPLERGWDVGATLTVPLFSGFLTRYQVAESRANLNAAAANQEALRQTVIFEVRQAYLNLMEAGERVPAAEASVKQAEENLELANARYAAGVGNPIESADASVAYGNARLAYFQALTDGKIAQAGLEKAIGGGR
ncbi:MAG: TolC family protein [Deltaproteobacteria bacterium]|nr:TolC family protein [Deltaproteobacteria bacterium]